MANTAFVLNYLYIERHEALREYRQSLSFMRSNEIKGKRELYEYH